MATNTEFLFVFKAWQQAHSKLRNCCHNTEDRQKDKLVVEVISRTFLTCFALLFLSSCAVLETGKELITGATSYYLGGEDNNEPPAELVDYEPELEIDVLWEEDIGVGANDKSMNLILAVSYGKVLAADNEGLVQARDIKTGELIWETDTDYHFSAGPGVGRKIAVLATSNAEIIAIDIDKGDILWTTSVSSEVLAKPVVADNKVVVRTSDGRVIALS